MLEPAVVAAAVDRSRTPTGAPGTRTSVAGSACAVLTQLRVPAATMEDSARSKAQPIRESVPLMPIGRTYELCVTADNTEGGLLVCAK